VSGCLRCGYCFVFHRVVKDGQYFLTHSKEEKSSCEADSCSATEEITRILLNLKVCYCVHKSPWLIPFECQINPIHIRSRNHFIIKIGRFVTMVF
jgi:hypothetical protein